MYHRHVSPWLRKHSRSVAVLVSHRTKRSLSKIIRQAVFSPFGVPPKHPSIESRWYRCSIMCTEGNIHCVHCRNPLLRYKTFERKCTLQPETFESSERSARKFPSLSYVACDTSIHHELKRQEEHEVRDTKLCFSLLQMLRQNCLIIRH